mmetsp:Transcript_7454/g.10481  ORF Transcript_7454/g.10481 Transcript_7454/m.10481 type:complete len:84 (+) Transcript_7454:1787-2038(+)
MRESEVRSGRAVSVPTNNQLERGTHLSASENVLRTVAFWRSKEKEALMAVVKAKVLSIAPLTLKSKLRMHVIPRAGVVPMVNL